MSRLFPDQPNRYSVEITTTQSCNFRCTYCFENNSPVPKKNILYERIDDVIKQLDILFSDPWFDGTFDNKNIAFWGGEPSLNIEMIEKIVDYFLEDRDVTFFIYTNGSRIKELMPILLKCKDVPCVGINKFNVQVSYDGEIIQNLRRVFPSSEGTSDIVKKGMELLFQHKIDFGLKPTIMYADFKYLPEIWNEFERFYDRYGCRMSITPDYHNVNFLKYKDDIEKVIIEIAKKELIFYKKHKNFLSNILASKKMFCGCGKGMASFDIDGKMYYCHGCFYSDDVKSCASIFDIDLPQIIKRNFEYFHKTDVENVECATCVALTCLKCNVKKFELSKKERFLDRWHDYTVQTELCEYFKLCGRIGRAVLNIIKEENNGMH